MGSGLSDLARIAELTRQFQLQVARNRIATYRPYPWQKDFHAAGIDNPERMLMAANRCITPWTIVETVPQARRIVELIDEKRFYVRSWADGFECIAQASGVFLKGIEPAFRVLLDSGQWFDCSRKHRVLTTEGWLSLGRLIRLSSGLRWTQTREDFLASCGVDGRLDDRQLLLAVGIAQGQPPSPSDAPLRAQPFAKEDAAAHILRCSRAYRQRGQIAIEGAPDLILDLCAAFADPAPYIDALRRNETHKVLVQSAAELARVREYREGEIHRFSSVLSLSAPNECRAVGNSPATATEKDRAARQSVSRFYPGQAHLKSPDDAARTEIFYPSSHPALIGERQIVSVVPLGCQPILDFTVEGTHNYRAGGVIHHNTGKTVGAGAECSYHLTGEYPDWWEGRRFDKPTLVWTGSPTNETSKDIVQNELLGGVGETLGTGWVPRSKIVGRPTTRQAGVKNVVDSFTVRHKSGGLSLCVLKTYEQGWQKWQGTAPHVVWMDEEPDDYKIFSESQTRVLTSKGIVLVTFTPLLGMTELVEHFMTGGPGIYLKGATWDDAPHLKKEDRDRLALSYRGHERQARTQGIPMMGEGAVFPVADETITVDPFRIPEHWPRGKACDFGIDHPAAGCELAWDRDQDIVYLLDCYKKAGETAPYHAAWFNKGNKRVPVFWPHDGMNREKSGGKTLAQHYTEHGVSMFSKSARYPKARGETEDKGGPQPVEPIVDEMLERMMTGRFKVFSPLREFFEEKRSYHRKDGKIVDRRDDILKAVFYGVMMKRYWVAPDSLVGRLNRAPQHAIASVRI